jgi:hypothetical protein
MAAAPDPRMRALDCQAGGRAIERILEDPEAVMEERLRQLLERGAATEFGRKHRLGAVRSLAEYRDRVPPTRYEDMAPYVARMVEEDAADLLFPGKAVFFAQTSGTSGDPKLFPYSADEVDFGALRLGAVVQAIEDAHAGATSAGVTFFGRGREAVTPGGVPIGSASGFILSLFDHPWLNWMPPEIWEVADFDARYYAALRIAIPRRVRMLKAFNPSTIIMLFDKALEFGSSLVEDLRAGRLSSEVKLPGEVRQALAPHLRPDPDAAERLARVLERRGRFEPLEIWPQLSVIVTWKAGMCAHYLPDLAARAPGCGIFSTIYSASEGIFALPLRTEWRGGIPAVMESVLEFYPANGSPEGGPFVPLSRLEKGQEYRMLLTNHRGLFRYPIDDVSTVETWEKNAPVIAFSHRYGNTSSLTGEKLTEPQVNAAMERALAGRGLRPRDFQVAPLWASPPHYVVLVEFEGPDPGEAALRDLAQAIDRALHDLNVEYASKRKTARLGPAAVGVLRAGEFERMRRERSSDRGRSDAQVKIPRLVRELANLDDYSITSTTR